MIEKLRIILDGRRGGAENMAIDEALLRLANGEATATLRLYGWAEPTLSLGYFQAAGNLPASFLAGLPIVRRPTGGGAIIHADELTYCLIVPTGEHRDPARLYPWMHGVIAAAAAGLNGSGGRAMLTMRDGGAPGQASDLPKGWQAGGEFFCFRRRGRWDLLAGEAKVAGSAQRRTGRAILQHGSVILGRSVPAQGSGALSEALGRRVEFDELAAAVIEVIRGRKIEAESGTLTAGERRLAGELRAKHESPQWLRRR